MRKRVALVFVLFVLFSAVFFLFPRGQELKPVYSEAEITKEITDYLVEWWGFWDVNVTGLEFVGGKWFANVSITSETGTVPTRILVYESNVSNKFELLWMNRLLAKPLGLSELPGKQSCSEGGKLSVMLFTDPYCEACIMHRDAVKRFKQKFNKSIDFSYHVLLTESVLLAQKKANGNASLETLYSQEYRSASRYLLCVQELKKEKFADFEDCFYRKYDAELKEPVSVEELSACASELGVSESDLSSCVAQSDSLIYSDNALASTYLAPSITPRIVLDCTFKSTVRTAEYGVCKEFPETNGC
ncbi:hypothetical protein HY992_05440 [Candidatus Micrarchaeota archaeon]|nr:hypothetical protein [Candidatus Micrarchaeota archaeon]